MGILFFHFFLILPFSWEKRSLVPVLPAVDFDCRPIGIGLWLKKCWHQLQTSPNNKTHREKAGKADGKPNLPSPSKVGRRVYLNPLPAYVRLYYLFWGRRQYNLTGVYPGALNQQPVASKLASPVRTRRSCWGTAGPASVPYPDYDG